MLNDFLISPYGLPLYLRSFRANSRSKSEHLALVEVDYQFIHADWGGEQWLALMSEHGKLASLPTRQLHVGPMGKVGCVNFAPDPDPLDEGKS